MTRSVRASVLRSLLIDTVIAQEAAAAGVAATAAEIQAQVSADAAAAGGPAQLRSSWPASGVQPRQLRDESARRINEQKLEDVFARQRAPRWSRSCGWRPPFGALAAQYSDDSTTAARTVASSGR